MDFRKYKNKVNITQEENVYFLNFKQLEEPEQPNPEYQEKPGWLQLSKQVPNIPFTALLDQKIIHLEFLKTQIEADIIRLQKSSKTFYIVLGSSCFVLILLILCLVAVTR